MREVEKEKRELEQQIITERKTLNCLREDLVSEKVRIQVTHEVYLNLFFLKHPVIS